MSQTPVRDGAAPTVPSIPAQRHDSIADGCLGTNRRSIWRRRTDNVLTLRPVVTGVDGHRVRLAVPAVLRRLRHGRSADGRPSIGEWLAASVQLLREVLAAPTPEQPAAVRPVRPARGRIDDPDLSAGPPRIRSSGTNSTPASAAPWNAEPCARERRSCTGWANASTTRRYRPCSGRRDSPDLTRETMHELTHILALPDGQLFLPLLAEE